MTVPSKLGQWTGAIDAALVALLVGQAICVPFGGPAWLAGALVLTIAVLVWFRSREANLLWYVATLPLILPQGLLVARLSVADLFLLPVFAREAHAVWRSGLPLPRSSMTWPFGLLLLTFAIGTLVGYQQIGRLTVYVLVNKDLGLLFQIAAFVALARYSRSREDVLRLAGWFVGGVSIANLAALGAVITAFSGIDNSIYNTGNGRLYGWMGQPHVNGGLLITAAMIEIGLLRLSAAETRFRSLRWANLSLVGLGLALTLSRGSWLSAATAAGALVALLLFFDRPRLSRQNRPVLAAAFIWFIVPFLAMANILNVNLAPGTTFQAPAERAGEIKALAAVQIEAEAAAKIKVEQAAAAKVKEEQAAAAARALAVAKIEEEQVAAENLAREVARIKEPQAVATSSGPTSSGPTGVPSAENLAREVARIKEPQAVATSSGPTGVPSAEAGARVAERAKEERAAVEALARAEARIKEQQAAVEATSRAEAKIKEEQAATEARAREAARVTPAEALRSLARATEEGGTLMNARGLEDRMAILYVGWKAFTADIPSMLLGIGLGTFFEISGNSFTVPIIIHSTFPWFLIELGPLGLFVVLAIWWLTASNLRKAILDADKSRFLGMGLLAAFAGLTVFCVVNEGFYQRQLWLVFLMADRLRMLSETPAVAAEQTLITA